ncbi:hypothetical protein PFISCL1PPCAC_14096, partial [Pristionchus fissidentatus]
CLAAANARVTFEKAEVIDHGDLKTTKKVAFQCPRECRVYTPTSTDYLRIVDDSDKLITSFTDLFKTPVKGPLELKGGNFSVINSAEGNPDFMLYIVQKDAGQSSLYNYNSPVYNTLQKVDASNQRFVTMISDTQGFRVSGLSGDLDKFNTTLYTVGADSVAKCRPVFTALSRDNAERTSFTISGPICTVDFGADQGTHVVTFGNDLNTQPSTAIGTSTVIVSPGHVGCAITGDQLYTNENTKNKDLPPYTVNIEDGSLPLKVFAEYSIQSLDAALEI